MMSPRMVVIVAWVALLVEELANLIVAMGVTNETRYIKPTALISNGCNCT